ncbi:hypothetical protein HK104_000694 [Borealophlyctis nickersoniae]|nr:hypothetical protein HK104_000694 [Borealophlyctis nickersoniae]
MRGGFPLNLAVVFYLLATNVAVNAQQTVAVTPSSSTFYYNTGTKDSTTNYRVVVPARYYLQITVGDALGKLEYYIKGDNPVEYWAFQWNEDYWWPATAKVMQYKENCPKTTARYFYFMPFNPGTSSYTFSMRMEVIGTCVRNLDFIARASDSVSTVSATLPKGFTHYRASVPAGQYLRATLLARDSSTVYLLGRVYYLPQEYTFSFTADYEDRTSPLELSHVATCAAAQQFIVSVWNANGIFAGDAPITLNAYLAACTKCTTVNCRAHATCSTSDGNCYCDSGYTSVSGYCYRQLSFTQGAASVSETIEKGFTHYVASIPKGMSLKVAVAGDGDLKVYGRAGSVATDTAYAVKDNGDRNIAYHDGCEAVSSTLFLIGVFNNNWIRGSIDATISAYISQCNACTRVVCPTGSTCSLSTVTCVCNDPASVLVNDVCYKTLDGSAHRIVTSSVSPSTYAHHVVNIPVGYLALVTLYNPAVGKNDLYLRYDIVPEGYFGWDDRATVDDPDLPNSRILSAQNCEEYSRIAFFSVWNPTSSTLSYTVSINLKPIPGDDCRKAWVQSEVMGMLVLSGNIYNDQVQGITTNIPFLQSCHPWTLISVRATSVDIKVGLYYSMELNYWAVTCEGTDLWDYPNDLVTDLNARWTPCYIRGTSCGMVHEGFYDAYKTIAVYIDEFRQLMSAASTNEFGLEPRFFVTGHSLGGALATHVAFDLSLQGLKVTVFTYGSPRVGNEVYRENYLRVVDKDQGNSTWRVVNSLKNVPDFDDLITMSPPASLGFAHVVSEFSVYSPVSVSLKIQLHFTDAYSKSVLAGFPPDLKAVGNTCTIPQNGVNQVGAVPATVTGSTAAGGSYAYYVLQMPAGTSIKMSLTKNSALDRQLSLVAQFNMKPTLNNYVAVLKDGPGDLSVENCRDRDAVLYLGVISKNILFSSAFQLSIGSLVKCLGM